MKNNDLIERLLEFPPDAEILTGTQVRPRPITQVSRLRLTKGGRYTDRDNELTAIVICDEMTETQMGFSPCQD